LGTEVKLGVLPVVVNTGLPAVGKGSRCSYPYGEMISAQEAYRITLVNEIVPLPI